MRKALDRARKIVLVHRVTLLKLWISADASVVWPCVRIRSVNQALSLVERVLCGAACDLSVRCWIDVVASSIRRSAGIDSAPHRLNVRLDGCPVWEGSQQERVGCVCAQRTDAPTRAAGKNHAFCPGRVGGGQRSRAPREFFRAN